MTALLSIVVLALLMGATTAGAQRQEVVTVAIRDFYFDPSRLVIEPGTTVRWVNEGTTQHTVLATSPAGAFLSETLNPGESFTHTFPQRFPRPSPDRRTVEPGTFQYLCKIHPEMKGKVVFGEAEREGTTVQQPPTTVPPRNGEAPTPPEREDTAVQQPPSAPRTGGLDPVLLIGLLVILAAVGVLGWAVGRRSS